MPEFLAKAKMHGCIICGKPYQLNLSARAHDRILKLAQTISVLAM
jgi:hypothetical protein